MPRYRWRGREAQSRTQRGFTNHVLPGGGGLATEWNPVALYVQEIGAINLLDARREIEIGRRIEACRVVLRRTLAAIPEYDALLAVAIGCVRAI